MQSIEFNEDIQSDLIITRDEMKTIMAMLLFVFIVDKNCLSVAKMWVNRIKLFQVPKRAISVDLKRNARAKQK